MGKQEPHWLEQWVFPYAREPMLWPILLAILGHVVVGVSALELAIWRVGSVSSGLVVGVLLVGTAALAAFEVRRTGRAGAVTGALLLSWIASVAFAVLAERTGIL